ncbi:MAG: efflux RND transporter permease subunit [Candidatus Eisenbacteria bacterium]|nr:efflux RND transporter permease subunit [Candidatus Eisenbacteria bacterium]
MIRFFIRHPVTAWMLFAALTVMGIYALPRLDIEAMPETELPSLTISTTWLGASPSAVQRSITVPIEEAAQRVHGIEKIVAKSLPGRSEVEVSFRRDINIEFARLELAEHLGSVRRLLPPSAGQPSVVPFVPEEFRTNDFFTVSLVSPLPADELRDRAEDWLVPRLLAIPGVADAELQGGARHLVRIRLSLELLERYGLTPDGVFQRLSALDEIVPSGAVRVHGLEWTVSIRNLVSLETIGNATLASVGGQSITLRHVAVLDPGFEDPAYFVRINGENVIQAVIAKRTGENAVSVGRRIRQALPALGRTLPFAVVFEIDSDQGKVLEEKLSDLGYRSCVILGVLFLLLAVTLRNVRLTVVVIVSVVLAIFICFALFYFFGVAVNFITISGLTVCFGMLLDNSILVLDAVYRRLAGGHRETSEAALIAGTREVAFPIMATTLTTVVAFLSFTFLSGRLALYYVPLAVSVGIAMAASIFVALCWMPVALRGPARHAARGAASQGEVSGTTGTRLFLRWSSWLAVALVVATGVSLALKGAPFLERTWRWGVGITVLLVIAGAYVSFAERLTRLSLRVPWFFVIILLGLSAGAYHVFDEKIDKGGFWQTPPEERLRLYMERPPGTDVRLTTETLRQFEHELTPVPDGIHLKSTSWENRGYLEIRFEPERLRSEYPELYRRRLIMLAEEMGGMFIWIGGFGDPYLKGGAGGGISNSLLKVTGYNSKILDQISRGVVARLEKNRRVRNVRITSGAQFERDAASETVIRIRRDVLVQSGLSVAEVMAFLRRLLGIEVPWRMMVDGEDTRFQLSYADAGTIQQDQVLQAALTTMGGKRVRLGDIISVETQPVVGSINRENQRYARQINWEYIGTDKMRRRFLGDMLAGIDLPYGYTAEDVSGQPLTEEEEEEVQTMLWLTLLFIFMALAAMFESMALPLLIMLSVPMALIGVVGLFWAADGTFDSSAKIGLVLLFGVVVNNAILLVERFRLQIRQTIGANSEWGQIAKGKPRLGGADLWPLDARTRGALLKDAVCSGTRIQMRSILLTSGTTIAGLLPLLIRLTEQTQGKDIWENLALSSIGGLVSSTVLILVTFPALYWIGVRAGWGIRGLWHRLIRHAGS